MSRTKSDRQPPTVRQLTNRPVDLENVSRETNLIDGVLEPSPNPDTSIPGSRAPLRLRLHPPVDDPLIIPNLHRNHRRTPQRFRKTAETGVSPPRGLDDGDSRGFREFDLKRPGQHQDRPRRTRNSGLQRWITRPRSVG